jgi:predicted nucleic-acid-binding Zn-ribbon protein
MRGFIMRRGPCPKCESSEIVRDVRVIDRGDGNLDAGDLSVAVYADPRAWLFKGKTTTGLSACVCAESGYAELYAADPQALARAANAAAASPNGPSGSG